MPSSPPSVLIVEDEAIIALDLRRQLESSGFVVVGVEARAAAVIPAVQRLRPSLVLMDVRLQGAADGITLAEEIHHLENVAVVFLSAYTDGDLLERAARSGGYAYLVKPFSTSTLVATLGIAVQKHAELMRHRTNAEWMAATLSSLPTAIVALDAAGALVFANAAAERVTGERRLDLAARPAAWVDRLSLHGTATPVEFLLSPGAPACVRATALASVPGPAAVRVWRLETVPAP